MRLAAATALMFMLAGPAAAALVAQDAARDTGQNADQSADALLGAWQLERETPRGTMQVPFTFTAEGDSVVVYVGEGEDMKPMGTVDFDGTTVSFPLDVRALMQQAMARRGGGQRAGAAGRAGQRAGGPPQRAGQGAAGRGAGGPTGVVPPKFSGTLEGATLTGSVASPRGEQAFVLRRVEGSS